MNSNLIPKAVNRLASIPLHQIMRTFSVNSLLQHRLKDKYKNAIMINVKNLSSTQASQPASEQTATKCKY
jgi:hypothetical protein